MRAVTSIRLVTREDAEILAERLHRNREFLAPWQPSREPEFFTRAGQRAAIERALQELEQGTTLPHVIVNGDTLVGRVTLSNIVRGPFQSCNIGYWVTSEENGRGHATAAVEQISRIAFGELALHRIEAGTLPENIASQRVLEHNCFTRIGVAPAYLRIAGRWQDHVLYQKLAPGT